MVVTEVARELKKTPTIWIILADSKQSSRRTRGRFRGLSEPQSSLAGGRMSLDKNCFHFTLACGRGTVCDDGKNHPGDPNTRTWTLDHFVSLTSLCELESSQQRD